MTTVITRLYADETKALAVAKRLRWEGFPRSAVQVVTTRTGEDQGTLAARMERVLVPAEAAPVYAGRVAGGNALLIVRATYKPLGAARIAREALERTGAIDVGDVPDDVYVKDPPDHAPSIMKDHPRFFTLPFEDDDDFRAGPVTPAFGFRLLSPPRERRSAISGGRYMSRFFWPMPLLTRNRRANSAISGGRQMSRAFWPMPLLSTRRRKMSVIRGGALPLSNLLGWRPISRR